MVNDLQEQHVMRLNSVFVALNQKKYEAGTKEHTGNLFDVDVLPLLKNIREEAIDTFNYCQSAIDAIEGKFPGE